jgi:starch synthase
VRVLFVTPECYPLIKTGGLADVAGALPVALTPLGVDARVLLPAYPGLAERLVDPEPPIPIPAVFGGPGRLLGGRTTGGPAVWLLEAPHLYERTGGGPYLGPDGRDWPDNDVRFAALSWVGAALARGELTSWRPQVVHLHDWQAALTAAYLRFGPQPAPPTLLTIHNLAFQGLFPRQRLAALGLPPSSFSVDGLEYHGQISFLKAGVRWAQRLSTVSPSYAREILTPDEGMGFDGILRERAGDLSGIVNGIDDEIWDPARDPFLVAPYSVRSLNRKATSKAALQAEFGLAVDPASPLACVVSRLTTQKGLDLLLAVLPGWLARGGQLALLGSGDRGLEAGFLAAADQHPDAVGVRIGYDEPLSHRLQGGADVIIVPSRFEPCGLTQLYGLRYGTIPVVARVGGLADTVIDANDAALRAGVATGFQFSPVTAPALGGALERVHDLWADRKAWSKLQRRAMASPVGWSETAPAYLKRYREMSIPV